MRVTTKVFKVLICLGLLFPALGFCQSPGIPHQFYGGIGISDGIIPDGLTVEAKINGTVFGTSVTADGKYGYLPDLMFVTDPSATNSGKIIKFYVDGVEAEQTFVFNSGASTQLSLAVAWEPAEEESVPVAAPAGGGGSGWYYPASSAPVTAVLSAAAQKADGNKDNKIDILDFNLLMVNWGSTSGGSIADFNNDSKVDIFDFNLLMIYWTV